MEAKMGALSGYILLLFLWVMVASASQETFLIGEKEEHCFYIHAEENEEFKARVFVFHGGSRDIVFSVHGPVPLDPEGNPRLGMRKWVLKHEVKVVSLAIGDGGDARGSRGATAESDGDDAFAEGFSGHEFKFTAAKGEYEACLSNDRRVEQDAKHVMLDISRLGTKDGDGAKENAGDAHHADNGKDDSDLMLITKGVQELGGLFSAIERFQKMERMRLTQRTIGAEKNHESMMQSSVMESVVLLVVGVGQIFFVRRWFQGKGTLLKQWA